MGAGECVSLWLWVERWRKWAWKERGKGRLEKGERYLEENKIHVYVKFATCAKSPDHSRPHRCYCCWLTVHLSCISSCELWTSSSDVNYCRLQSWLWINEIFKELHEEFDPGIGALLMSCTTLNDNVPFDGSSFVRLCANITNWVLPQLTETVNTMGIYHHSNPSHYMWVWMESLFLCSYHGESAGLCLKDMIHLWWSPERHTAQNCFLIHEQSWTVYHHYLFRFTIQFDISERLRESLWDGSLAPTTMPDKLSLITRSHRVEGEN